MDVKNITLAEFLLARYRQEEESIDLAAEQYAERLENERGKDVPAFVPNFIEVDIEYRRADMEAKRRIVEAFAPVVRDGGDGEFRLEQVFKMLALPYASHPDYCEEWRM